MDAFALCARRSAVPLLAKQAFFFEKVFFAPAALRFEPFETIHQSPLGQCRWLFL